MSASELKLPPLLPKGSSKRGVRDVPLHLMITAVIEHLPLSCRLGEQGQSGGGLRCPKGYGRVQIRSACKSCNEGWYLTGKALLGQEIEGERPPWQGQRK